MWQLAGQKEDPEASRIQTLGSSTQQINTQTDTNYIPPCTSTCGGQCVEEYCDKDTNVSQMKCDPNEQNTDKASTPKTGAGIDF